MAIPYPKHDLFATRCSPFDTAHQSDDNSTPPGEDNETHILISATAFRYPGKKDGSRRRLKQARISSTNKSGCSNAAKWPPFSGSFQ